MRWGFERHVKYQKVSDLACAGLEKRENCFKGHKTDAPLQPYSFGLQYRITSNLQNFILPRMKAKAQMRQRDERAAAGLQELEM